MKRRTEHFTYELLRSRRRSMSLKVELDGTITVRAPFRTPPETADWFVESHRDWIEVRLRAGEQILAVRPSYTETERLEGKKKSGKRVKRTMLLLRRAHGRFLWIDHGPGAKDALGELQCKGKPEF